jgi:hypothetical protein
VRIVGSTITGKSEAFNDPNQSGSTATVTFEPVVAGAVAAGEAAAMEPPASLVVVAPGSTDDALVSPEPVTDDGATAASAEAGAALWVGFAALSGKPLAFWTVGAPIDSTGSVLD